MYLKVTLFSLFSLVFSVFFCNQTEKTTPEHSNAHLPDTFTVAFYNLENLFDATYNGSEFTEYNPDVSNWDEAMFQKKISNSADVIRAINADIIGFCEIENTSSLKSLQKELIKRGCQYKYRAIGDFPLKTNTCVALLSKFPVKKINSIEVRLEDGSITRNILETDVECKCTTLKVFVNHWPSMRHPEQSRITAAKVLAKRIEQLPLHAEYILMGDFNSNYNECEISDKHHKKRASKASLNNYLQTIYGDPSGKVAYIDEQDMISGSKGHFDPWIELPQNLRMSEMFNGYNQTLDHILLPHSLFDKEGISYIDNSFATFTWSGKLLKGNVPYRWQFKKIGRRKEHTGCGYSDHLPLTAQFICGKFTKITDSNQNFVSNKHTAINRPIEDNSISQKWTSCNNFLNLTDDTMVNGKHCLHLHCDPLTSNNTIARKYFKPKKSTLAFFVKGSGKLGFRIRSEGENWQYYNAPDFKESKSARYSAINYSDWEKIQLEFKSSKIPDKIEVEIRAGKNLPFDLFLMETTLYSPGDHSLTTTN